MIISHASMTNKRGVGYLEKHHIIPKSMGGTNDPTNFVLLTARQHFVCHMLLTKMVTGSNVRKAWMALRAMAVMDSTKQQKRKLEIVVSSRMFEKFRIINGLPDTPEILIKKRAAYAKRKPHSEETKKKMSDRRKYRFANDMTYKEKCLINLSKSNMCRKVTQITRDRISIAGKSRRGIHWKIISPSEQVFHTYRLLQFCATHGLYYHSLLESCKQNAPVAPRIRNRKSKISVKRDATVGWRLIKCLD